MRVNKQVGANYQLCMMNNSTLQPKSKMYTHFFQLSQRLYLKRQVADRKECSSTTLFEGWPLKVGKVSCGSVGWWGKGIGKHCWPSPQCGDGSPSTGTHSWQALNLSKLTSNFSPFCICNDVLKQQRFYLLLTIAAEVYGRDRWPGKTGSRRRYMKKELSRWWL